MSKYKSGTVPITIDVLQRIAKALECHTYELVAKAEGVLLPLAGESPEDHKLRAAMHAMEPDKAVVIYQLAAMLTQDDKQTKGPSDPAR